MLVELDHPRVLRYYGLYEDESGVYIVTDLCEGCVAPRSGRFADAGTQLTMLAAAAHATARSRTWCSTTRAGC